MKCHVLIAIMLLAITMAACTPHGPSDDVYGRWYGAAYQGGNGGGSGGGGGGM